MPNDAVVEAALATNHERIWLQPLCCVDERCWCQDPQPCEDCDLPAIEYVRADLAASPSPSDLARVKAALEIIAGQRQCIDNLMSNADVAIEALAILERAGA